MNKKQWAKYCHDYLLTTLHEEDEEDWSAARALRDIYDCHTCVYHIAQMYVKGIIPADKKDENTLLFNGDAEVSLEEADKYKERLTDKTKRLPVPKVQTSVIKKITRQEIEKLNNPIIIDVRPEHTFKAIYQNPLSVNEDLFQNIVLYCNKGYQSALIAELLIKSGYKNIFICPSFT